VGTSQRPPTAEPARVGSRARHPRLRSRRLVPSWRSAPRRPRSPATPGRASAPADGPAQGGAGSIAGPAASQPLHSSPGRTGTYGGPAVAASTTSTTSSDV
jgi:hypothetical protein